MRPLFCRIVLLACVLWLRSSSAGTLVQFHMYAGVNLYLGDVEVELYDQDKPITVSNFLAIAKSGFYQSSFFHRCIPGFVLQGGGYEVIDALSTNLIGPPYSNVLVGNFKNIPDEIHSGVFRSNTYGTIAMAKAGVPNSANSQFFFNLGNNSASLDDTNNAGGFTVFGHVVRGTNILNQFNGLSPGNGLINLTSFYGTTNITPAFVTLPENSGPTPPPYYQLIYFPISILTTQVTLQTNGSRLISWNSINGLTNNVEFSTNLQAAWQLLAATNGNGGPLSVTDSTTNKSGRFYRIHVLY